MWRLQQDERRSPAGSADPTTLLAPAEPAEPNDAATAAAAATLRSGS
jgi:hypothetical protein